MNLGFIFLTGLTTGGLSCLAVQGGLLTGIIANQKEQELAEVLSDQDKKKAYKKQQYVKSLQKSNFSLKSFDRLDWLPVTMFLLSKLTSHALFGFFLGALGSVITLGLGMRLAFQVFAAVFMFATAMNLLDVHPAFRFLAFQPPKFISKYIRSSTQSRAIFAPAILGLLTIFIPCGVTQAMEVLAINSGRPVVGALTMAAFVLGTFPLFATIGIATAKLSEGWHDKFLKVAAVGLVLMALYSVNGVLLVLDSPVTLNKIVRPVTYFFSRERFSSIQASQVSNGVQKVTLDVESRGYSPNRFQVKQGVPVELTLVTGSVYSCALDFTFREFGIHLSLKPNDTQTVTFTPTKKGTFTFACSMGMYTGQMEVI